MKKQLFLVILSITSLLSVAQNFDPVKTVVLLGKWEDAKTQIDKLGADAKAVAKPDFWYWKGRVNAALYKSEQLSVKYPTALSVADEALQKYLQMDAALKIVKEMGADGFFDIYATAFANGIKDFNAKTWEKAGSNFAYAVKYSDYIFQNKWSSSSMAFDTTSILYAGYSWQNAQKADEALKYYIRIADNKVAEKDYVDVYRYILLTYIDRKKSEDFQKYLAISKSLYPKEEWEQYEIEYLEKNYTLIERIDFYDKEDVAGNLSTVKYMQFADMFANLPKDEKAKMDSATLAKFHLKAIDAFKKAYVKSGEKEGVAAFNVGVLLYNDFNIYDDKYRANIKTMQDLNANKPVEKDPKKKPAVEAKFKEQLDVIKKLNTDLEKPMNEIIDNSIDWLEKSFVILKDKPNKASIDKNVLNKTVDFLSVLYGFKRDKARGKDQKAMDAYEAKFKLYDGLHGTF